MALLTGAALVSGVMAGYARSGVITAFAANPTGFTVNTPTADLQCYPNNSHESTLPCPPGPGNTDKFAGHNGLYETGFNLTSGTIHTLNIGSNTANAWAGDLMVTGLKDSSGTDIPFTQSGGSFSDPPYTGTVVSIAGGIVSTDCTGGSGQCTVLWAVTNTTIASTSGSSGSSALAFEFQAADTSVVAGNIVKKNAGSQIFANDPASATAVGVTPPGGGFGASGAYTVPVAFLDAFNNQVEGFNQHPSFNPGNPTVAAAGPAPPADANAGANLQYSGPAGGSITPPNVGPGQDPNDGGPTTSSNFYTTTLNVGSASGTYCVTAKAVNDQTGTTLTTGNAFCVVHGGGPPGTAHHVQVSSATEASPGTADTVTLNVQVVDATGNPTAASSETTGGLTITGNTTTITSDGNGSSAAASLNKTSFSIPAGMTTDTVTVTDKGVGTVTVQALPTAGASCALPDCTPAHTGVATFAAGSFGSANGTKLKAYLCTPFETPFGALTVSTSPLNINFQYEDADGNVVASPPGSTTTYGSSNTSVATVNPGPLAMAGSSGNPPVALSSSGGGCGGAKAVHITRVTDGTTTISAADSAHGIAGTLSVKFFTGHPVLKVVDTDPTQTGTLFGPWPTSLTNDGSTTRFWVLLTDGTNVIHDNTDAVTLSPSAATVGTATGSNLGTCVSTTNCDTAVRGVAAFKFTTNGSPASPGPSGATTDTASDNNDPLAVGTSIGLTVVPYAPAALMVTVDRNNVPVSGYAGGAFTSCQTLATGNFANVQATLVDGSGNPVPTSSANVGNHISILSAGPKTGTNDATGTGSQARSYENEVADSSELNPSGNTLGSCGNTTGPGTTYAPNVGEDGTLQDEAIGGFGTWSLALSNSNAETTSFSLHLGVGTIPNANFSITWGAGNATTLVAVTDYPDFPGVALANGADAAKAPFRTADIFGNFAPPPSPISVTAVASRGSLTSSSGTTDGTGLVVFSNTSSTPSIASGDNVTATPASGSGVKGSPMDSIWFGTRKLLLTTSPATVGPNQVAIGTLESITAAGQVDTTDGNTYTVQADDQSNPNVPPAGVIGAGPPGNVPSPFFKQCHPISCDPRLAPGGNPFTLTLTNGAANFDFVVNQSEAITFYAGGADGTAPDDSDKNLIKQPASDPTEVPGTPTGAEATEQFQGSIPIGQRGLRENRPFFHWNTIPAATHYVLTLFAGTPTPFPGSSDGGFLASVSTTDTSLLGNTSGLPGGPYAWNVHAFAGSTDIGLAQALTPFDVGFVQSLVVNTFDPSHPAVSWVKPLDDCLDVYCYPPDKQADPVGNIPQNVRFFGVELLKAAPMVAHDVKADPNRIAAAVISPNPNQAVLSFTNPPEQFNGCANNPSDCPHNLISGHVYFIRVIAVNQFSYIGGLSDAGSFTAP
jgi:hypothetical protein